MRAINTTDYKRITNALIEARKTAGLTQKQVGALLGRDQSFVSKYERMERRLDVVEFKVVCEVLGLDAAELVRSIRIGNNKK